MNQINTIPIESFLEKANILLKNGQKSLTLDIKEVEALYDCLAITMTRLAGQDLNAQQTNQLTQNFNSALFKVDGGKF